MTATAGRLLRTAVFLVYDRHLAEDLVQTVFERLARRWRKVARNGHPEAYARKVLVNLAIDEHKRRDRRGETLVGSASALDRLATGPAVSALDPGLDEALATLPAKQRAVIVLRYWCDLTELEIADALGISCGTVKSHTSRAMKSLRTHLFHAEFHPGRGGDQR